MSHSSISPSNLISKALTWVQLLIQPTTQPSEEGPQSMAGLTGRLPPIIEQASYADKLSKPTPRLSPEVLSRIFSHLPPNNFRDACCVSQVCSYWYNVIVSDSCLWSHLTIETQEYFPTITSCRRIDDLCFFLSTALARSKSRRLNVHFVHVVPDRDFGDDIRDELAQASFGTLLRHCDQFSSLTLITDLNLLTGSLIPAHGNYDFPSLHTLFLHIIPLPAPAEESLLGWSSPKLWFYNTQRHYLHSFNNRDSVKALFLPQLLDNADLHSYPHRVHSLPPLPFKTLTHVVIGNCSKFSLLELLRSSSSTLEVCKITGFTAEHGPPIDTTTKFPSLRVLTLPAGHDDIQELAGASAEVVVSPPYPPINPLSWSDFNPPFWLEFNCHPSNSHGPGIPVFSH
ncbi:hypothetical protein AAF712_010306 [Marasmius tenuissimus]|uniref:F-box domain-containing protein n=1 Tax=Marasmius tenuissimus TaxID=585030 RepID=A0ABR2ZMY5_9AGAR